MEEMQLKVELDITISKDYKVTVNSTRVIPILGEEQDLVIEQGRITASTFQYGVIYFPSKGELANALAPGDKLKVKYYDNITSINITAKKGRLAGLTNIVHTRAFLNEFEVDDDIELRYDKNTKIIELKKPQFNAQQPENINNNS